MYPSLILKSGRDRSVSNRHPWIFSGAIKEMPQKAENGDIVAICDNHQHILGYGFFSPQSQITCRMFECSPEPIDFSKPDYWVEKIQKAYSFRQHYVTDTQTTAYRLLHAEGDFMPGIIADVYGDIVVVQLLIRGTEKIYKHLLQGFEQIGFNKIYLKNKENPHRFEEVSLPNGWLTTQKAESNTIVLENKLKFQVDFEHGQKTGFFLDQRDNRQLLMHYSHQKRVLNTFCYTGGFSVYALAGGATEVHSVDISKDAVVMSNQNVKLNFGENAPHAAFAEDCFDYLRKTSEKYDVIVLDPPAFAKNARSVPNASRGYKDLNMTAIQKIKSGGIIFTFSCSQNIDKDLFRKIVFSAAADAKRNVKVLHQLSQPIDHPINIFHPESEYLKGLVLWVE